MWEGSGWHTVFTYSKELRFLKWVYNSNSTSNSWSWLAKSSPNGPFFQLFDSHTKIVHVPSCEATLSMSINVIPVFCSWKSNAIWYRANYMESILWEKAVESHFQLPSDAWSAFSSMFIFETKDNKQLRHFTSRFFREPAILTILDHLRNPLRSLRPLLATTSSGSQPTIPLPGEKKKVKSQCACMCACESDGYLRVWYSASHFYLDTFWHDINSGYSLVNMVYYFLTSALLRNKT